jgi:GT2 family glycosyltransferase
LLNVYVCITTRNGTPPRLVFEMATAACQALADAGVASSLSIQEDRYSVAFGRNQGVQDALLGGYSHVFFIDDDVYIPPDTIVRLLKHNKDVIAGCYPSIRTEFPNDLKASTYVVVKHNGEWLPKFFKGLRQVDAAGTGCLLIRTTVFPRVGFPWFRWPEFLTAKGEHCRVSDDYDFCQRCIKAGIPVFADGDVRCGHKKEVDIANFVGEEE